MGAPVTSGFDGQWRPKYGLDWPAEMTDVQIDLTCAKKWREPMYRAANLSSANTHMLRAIRTLFPPNGSCPFVISPWTEEHVFDFTTRDFVITWGCASSSKSNDYGLLLVLDWSTDPHDTYSIVGSTTKNMLMERTFESVIRYWRYLKSLRIGWPGKLAKTRMAIVNDEDDDEENVASVKAMIKGVAVEEGSEDDSRAKMQGSHMQYVRQVGDELSQMRRSFMKVRVNLRSGSKDFRFFGLCNPDNLADLASEHSEPLRGWSSIDIVASKEWETKFGWVRHHNGFFSPAITEPGGKEKYPYLINQDHIDGMIKDAGGNADDPIVWTMARGCPAPQGKSSTPITAQMYKVYKMGEEAVWRGLTTPIAFLDPAYTGDGDECVLWLADIGWAVLGEAEAVLTLGFTKRETLKISGSSGVLVTDQIKFQVAELLKLNQVSINHFGVDDSGVQNIGDILAAYLGHGIFRMRNNGKASALPVSAFDNTPCNERYYDQLTEALYSMRLFAQHGQIRGLDVHSAEDLYCRLAVIQDRKFRAESKKDIKKRLRRSPDKGDAALGVVQLARLVLGFDPGSRILVGLRNGAVTDDRLPEIGTSIAFSPSLRDKATRLCAANFAQPE